MRGFFDGVVDQLPQALNNKLQAAGKTRIVQSGQLIHSRSDNSNSLLIIKRGKVLVSIDDQHGKRIEIATLTTGQSLGALSLLAGGVRTHDATAAQRTELLVVTKKQFDELLGHDAQFRAFIVRLLSSRLMQTLELLDDERRLPLLPRVGKQLLRREDVGTLRGSSQSALAEELGVSRYAYGKALALLREQELIQTAYREIRIRDRAALFDWIEASISHSADTE